MRLKIITEILERLQRIEWKLDCVLALEGESMANIDDLVQKIQDESTLVGGVLALVTSLKEQLKAQGLDAQKVDAAFANAEADRQRLADALVANTPNA